MARCARALFEVVAVAAQHRPGRGGNTALVGAALRAVRIPTNMGVAQLTSHSPLYPNSRLRPIFSFPAAPAAAVTPEACPYHANPSVGATTPPWEGRLGTRVARLGSLQIASPAYAAVTSVPSAYPQIWAWRNWLLIRPPLPQLSLAPDFLISCGVCRSGHAGGVPLPANPSVGAALRADRIQRTPRRGVPTTWRPYHVASLPRDRPTSRPRTT